MERKLANQIAIITGAGSSIGAGVAKVTARAGAKVVINYPIDAARDKAEKVKEEIGASNGDVITYQANVCKEEVKQMFADVIKQYGTVDILVNNAVLQKDAPFKEMTIEQWNFVLSVNLTGQFLCARMEV